MPSTGYRVKVTSTNRNLVPVKAVSVTGWGNMSCRDFLADLNAEMLLTNTLMNTCILGHK